MLMTSIESVIKFAANFEGRLNIEASKCILNHESCIETQDICALYPLGTL